jgi:hypothetical protein
VESQTQNHRKWFVAADAPRTEEAIDSLKQIRADEFSACCPLVVIDVLGQPVLAEAKKIIAIPPLTDSIILRRYDELPCDEMISCTRHSWKGWKMLSSIHFIPSSRQ